MKQTRLSDGPEEELRLGLALTDKSDDGEPKDVYLLKLCTINATFRFFYNVLLCPSLLARNVEVDFGVRLESLFFSEFPQKPEWILFLVGAAEIFLIH
jgi:hypothetical protein